MNSKIETRQLIAKANDALLDVAKAFMAAYDQSEEGEWNREWQELAETCRAAIAMAEAQEGQKVKL